MSNIVCGNMSPDMVDGHQRQTHRHSRTLGEVHTHQHRTDQAGGIGDGNGVQIGLGHTGIGKGLVGEGGNGLHMLAGSDLGDYAAVDGVHFDLRGHAVGQNGAAVLHNGNGSLVAGGFNS